jgi:hypothetical protein
METFTLYESQTLDPIEWHAMLPLVQPFQSRSGDKNAD